MNSALKAAPLDGTKRCGPLKNANRGLTVQFHLAIPGPLVLSRAKVYLQDDNHFSNSIMLKKDIEI